MKLAFFKSSQGEWYDKIIGWFSKKTKRTNHGKYSHVEILFSDGISFTSVPGIGTCFRKNEYKDEEWDFLNLPKNREKEVRHFCEKLLGKKYNWRAIFWYVGGYFIGKDYSTLNVKENQYFWLCSEAINFILWKLEIISVLNVKICPSETYELFKDYFEEAF